MDFKINATQFKNVLDLVVSASDSRNTNVTSYVFIESISSTDIRLTGMGIDVSVQRTCSAEIKTEGKICIKAEKLLNVVKAFDTEIRIKTESNDWVQITAGAKSKHRIAALSGDSFPAFPVADSYYVTFPSNVFTNMVKSTAFSITSEDSRFTLNGVKLEIEDGIAKMVATDGHRVAYREEKVDGDLNIFLPKKSLSYLGKLSGEIEMGEDLNHLFFKTDDLVMCARKITGSFPDYTPVTGFATDKELSVSLEDFKVAVKRVLATASDKIFAIKFDLVGTQLTLSTNTEAGESEEVLNVDYTDKKDMVFNLNAAFLTDFLNSAVGDNIHIKFKNATSPIKFNFGEPNYIFTVMPLRVK